MFVYYCILHCISRVFVCYQRYHCQEIYVYINVQDSIIWHFLQMIGRFCQNSLVTRERRSAPATLRSIDVQQFVKAQLNARNQYFLLSQHASPLSLP